MNHCLSDAIYNIEKLVSAHKQSKTESNYSTRIILSIFRPLFLYIHGDLNKSIRYMNLYITKNITMDVYFHYPSNRITFIKHIKKGWWVFKYTTTYSSDYHDTISSKEIEHTLTEILSMECRYLKEPTNNFSKIDYILDSFVTTAKNIK